MKIRRLLLLLALAAAPFAYTPAALADTQNSPQTPETCQKNTHTVTLSASDPTPYRVAGRLCYRGNPAGKTVQLAVSGLTYDHQYWQWPQQAKTYSYVREATKAGYAVFIFDRLGTGESDHPADPDSLTTQSHAYVVYQLVQKLRAGEMGGAAFDKVILVGHSFGSQVAKYEAAVYGAVDGVILTGSLHQTSPQVFTVVAPTFYPAQFDPKFAGSGLPLGYLTTQPGTRGVDFYNTEAADPAVIAQDETRKQTAASGEFATITAAESLTPDIRVPVLLAMGQQDVLFCDGTLSCADSNAILARENSYYSPQACLEAVVQPNAGHSLNLHPNAHTWFDAALNWADRRVGTKGQAPSEPCPTES